MSQARVPLMSLDEFLAWERARDGKWEFDGFAPVAMTGGSVLHREVADGLAAALRGRLPPGCRALAGDVKVLTAGRARYPDLVIVCGDFDRTQDVAPDPVVVAEVVSPSSQRVDRFQKLEEYRQTPSIQHYLLLEQASADGLLFSRVEDQWVVRALSASDKAPLKAVGVDVAMADIYETTGLIAVLEQAPEEQARQTDTIQTGP